MTVYPSLWLSRFKSAIYSVESLALTNAHTTATGSAAYFTDPDGGQRYRISVEPIRPEQEPKFGDA